MSGVSSTPSSREQVADDLPGRRRVRDDEVDRAEARVVVVMVDVDDERRAVQHLGVGPEAALVRAVEREQDARRGIFGKRPAQVVERHPRVLARQRRLAGEVHDRILAERVERELGRQKRPECVAVRVLVRRDEKAVVRTDRLGDRAQVIRCRLGRAHLRHRLRCRPSGRRLSPASVCRRRPARSK